MTLKGSRSRDTWGDDLLINFWCYVSTISNLTWNSKLSLHCNRPTLSLCFYKQDYLISSKRQKDYPVNWILTLILAKTSFPVWEHEIYPTCMYSGGDQVALWDTTWTGFTWLGGCSHSSVGRKISTVFMKPLLWLPACHKLTYHPSRREGEAGGSKVQGHLQGEKEFNLLKNFSRNNDN